jgi:hypothetical protein
MRRRGNHRRTRSPVLVNPSPEAVREKSELSRSRKPREYLAAPAWRAHRGAIDQLPRLLCGLARLRAGSGHGLTSTLRYVIFILWSCSKSNCVR